MRNRIFNNIVCKLELMYNRKIRKAKSLLYQGKLDAYLKELIEASELKEIHAELLPIAL
jgi:hypothetical protein